MNTWTQLIRFIAQAPGNAMKRWETQIALCCLSHAAKAGRPLGDAAVRGMRPAPREARTKGEILQSRPSHGTFWDFFFSPGI